MVGVHATVRGPEYFGAGTFDQFIEVHTLSHAFAQMIQMTSLVLRGVLATFASTPGFRGGGVFVGPLLGRAYGQRVRKRRGQVEAPFVHAETQYLCAEQQGLFPCRGL